MVARIVVVSVVIIGIVIIIIVVEIIVKVFRIVICGRSIMVVIVALVSVWAIIVIAVAGVMSKVLCWLFLAVDLYLFDDLNWDFLNDLNFLYNFNLIWNKDFLHYFNWDFNFLDDLFDDFSDDLNGDLDLLLDLNILDDLDGCGHLNLFDHLDLLDDLYRYLNFLDDFLNDLYRYFFDDLNLLGNNLWLRTYRCVIISRILKSQGRILDPLCRSLWEAIDEHVSRHFEYLLTHRVKCFPKNRLELTVIGLSHLDDPVLRGHELLDLLHLGRNIVLIDNINCAHIDIHQEIIIGDHGVLILWIQLVQNLTLGQIGGVVVAVTWHVSFRLCVEH